MVSIWSRQPLLAIRILGTDGYYPRFSIRTSTHRFEVAEGLVWIAVIQPPLPDDWELPESPTFIPEEIRLLTAISLCEGDPWQRGLLTITRSSERWQGSVEHDFDLMSPDGEERIQAALNKLQGARAQAEHEPIPVYELGELGSQDDALALLENVDMSDELLLAGLANLHAAARLMSGSVDESEAAALCLFVSMGAVLEFIRLYLNETTRSANTSFADVHAYLGSIYPEGNDLPEYLKEIYKHRIIATHPSGRFGEYWTPALMAGDLYDLRKHLIVIYRHIILGERPAFETG